MPLYLYGCSDCQTEIEKFQAIDGEPIPCPSCHKGMVRKPTFPAMVKVKGMGGYPSRRKMIGDTAPYCRG